MDLRLNGRVHSLQSEAEAFILIKERLSGVETILPDAIKFLNKPRNSIKHMSGNDDTTVIMDPKEDAEDMLNRALTNWWRLEKSFTPLMEKFLDSQEMKYVQKASG
jgi:hypothetical protein